MKICRILSLLCTFALAFTLMACDGKKHEQANDPFFKLAETLSNNSTNSDYAYSRLNTEYTDIITPSENYGELLPFVSQYKDYSSIEGNLSAKCTVLGLCNESGAVVVDAVFDSIITHKTDEGMFAYELIIGSDNSDEYLGTHYVMSSDGSWAFKLPQNTKVYSIGADRVIVERKKTRKKVDYFYHDFYDFSGKRKFTFDKKLAENKNAEYTIGAFHDGFAPINVTVTEVKGDGDKKEKVVTTYAYFIDNCGKVKYNKFLKCEEFRNGYAVVQTEEGLFGVIDAKGEWFLEAEHRDIDYNWSKKLFACAEDGYYNILNMEKESVKKITCERGTIEIIDSENTIYKRTNSDTGRSEYFFLDSDKPVTCTENGQFPSGNKSINSLFVCTYSGTGTIFRETGESIVSIGDYGEFIECFGNTAVVVNSTDLKTCFVSISSKQRTEWMRYHYLRQSIGDRYLVLKSTAQDESTYYLYDIMTNTFKFEKCDYIEVTGSEKNKLLSVVLNGVATVYDSMLKPCMNIPNYTEH